MGFLPAQAVRQVGGRLEGADTGPEAGAAAPVGIGGLPLKLLAVEALLEIFVGITAEFRESGMCL